MRYILGCLLAAGWAFTAAADAFDPPVGYYSPATGTGSTLKQQLNDLIDNHVVRSYDDARFLLQDTDEDPADPDRMILIYDRVSLNVSLINPNGSIPGWDSAATWNREHTWPNSQGLGGSGPDYSDLHNLRPSFTTTNSNRGNLSFGGAYGQPFGVKSDQAATVWYPGDADAGMVARQMFYMDTRYDGADGGTTNLTLVDSGNPGTNQLGDLSRLLEWHYLAPPDGFERARNQRVYGIQSNRNPFIDRPEYVWSVFVDQQNDAQLFVGAGADVDGSSSTDVDLGSVIVGAAVPDPQPVNLVKLGNDGTYFDVTTSGDATSSVTGRYNAFSLSTSPVDLRTLDVGLDTSTATPGLRTGTVTINNLDVTTAGGAGRGANDGDDTINLSLGVLDHANASFLSSGDVNTLTLDFGQVMPDDANAALDFSIFNDASVSGLFTAGLDLDSVVGVGDTTVLTTDLGPFGALGAGLGMMFSAFVDLSTPGVFAATYTLTTSDEDLPGAASGEVLTLNLLAEVLEQTSFTDFNGNGQVEQGDLDLVLLNWGRDTAVQGIPVGWIGEPPVGLVDQAELDTVLLNWGATGEPDFPGSSVPEPALGVGLFVLMAWRPARARARKVGAS